jgi:hypothetical protein
MLVIYDDREGMGADYHVHAWFIGYHGETWKEQQSFPPVYNTSAHVGVPVPIFYGGLLYKCAGLLSAVWGCYVALRLIALCSFAAMYLVVRSTVRAFGAGEMFAVVTACATCWATYPLTNLYNRIALPEFVAGAMLTCSCCLFAQFFFRPGPSVRWRAVLAAGLFLGSVGSHPITAMLSIPVFGILYLTHWIVPVPDRPSILRRHLALLVTGLLVCVMLSPWLYAYHTLGSQLTGNSEFVRLAFYKMPWATLAWVRLFPLPFDYNLMMPNAPKIWGTSLDAQVSLPLLALAGSALWAAYRATERGGKWRLIVGGACVGLLGFVMYLLSVSPEVWAMLPLSLQKMGWKIQFAIRLVTIVNVAFLVLLLVALACRQAAARPTTVSWSGSAVVLGIVFTLTSCAMLQKAVYARAACYPNVLPTDRANPESVKWFREFGFHGAFFYGAANAFPTLSSEEQGQLHHKDFSIGTGQLGHVQPLSVNLASDGYVGTQAIPFRWNAFKVDGVRVPEWQLRTWDDQRGGEGLNGKRIAVPVPAGSHVVEYEFAPPRKWRALSLVSDWVTVGSTVLLTLSSLLAWLWRAVKGSGVESAVAPEPSPPAGQTEVETSSPGEIRRAA